MEVSKPIILFKFASRSRPEKFKTVVENLLEKIADKENFLILVSADTDDVTMNNREIKDFVFKHRYDVQIVYGESKSKIDAINRDVNECSQDWSILVNVSDDNEFIVDGFVEVIRFLCVHKIFPSKSFNVYRNFSYPSWSGFRTLSIS